jgi:hypothetical protein
MPTEIGPELQPHFSSRRGRLVLPIVLATLSATSARAAAPVAPAAAPAPTSQAKAEARERFDRGVRLFEQGDNASALAEFKRANELVPNPLVLYNMGLVYAAMGRPVESVDALTAFLAQAPNAKREQRRHAEEVQKQQSERIARLAVKTETLATVEIDGVEVGHTPLAEPIRLPSGTHVVTVQAPGFLPTRKEVTLAGQVSETLSITLLPAESRMAQLVITSVPGGAEVLVNGARMGTTPLPASVAVPPGLARVEVRRSGYLPAERTITLGEGARGELAFSLVEDPRAPATSLGLLRLSLREPDSEIFVDGVARKQATLRLPEGPHDLRVTHNGFETYQRTVNVTAGGETPLSLALSPTAETREQYESGVRTRRVVGWTLLGAGAAIAIAGGAYGIAKLGDVKDARSNLDKVLADEANPGNKCYINNPEYLAYQCDVPHTAAQNQVDSAVLRRNLGFVGAGVGLVAAGLGTYLLLASGDPNRYRTPLGVAITDGTVWTDGRAAGLALTGAF